jgi:ribosomal protein L34E
MTEPAQPTPSRDDPATMTCPRLPDLLHPVGRQTYCGTPCRKTAFRRRHQTPSAAITVPAARPRRDYTINECGDCGERLHGQQRCQPCGSFARRIGTGGLCPHCDQPVALSDLIDQETTIMPNRYCPHRPPKTPLPREFR